MRGRIALAAATIAGCAAAGRPPSPVASGPTACQPVDSGNGAWRLTVFVDGRRVGDHLAARRERVEPETFELSDPEPPGLASLRPDEFDLIQFSRGTEAEEALGLCPGYVALLVTTKRRR